MSPVDAAIEILRGQAPGRGMHVRQLAEAAVRRRLVHGEPNEAWRVMRAALATEAKERLRGDIYLVVPFIGAQLGRNGTMASRVIHFMRVIIFCEGEQAVPCRHRRQDQPRNQILAGHRNMDLAPACRVALGNIR